MRRRPEPYGWIATEGGIVERFDFQRWKRSDPPPINHEPIILQFPLGYMKNGCLLAR